MPSRMASKRSQPRGVFKSIIALCFPGCKNSYACDISDILEEEQATVAPFPHLKSKNRDSIAKAAGQPPLTPKLKIMKRVLLSIALSASLIGASAQNDSLPVLKGVVTAPEEGQTVPLANVVLKDNSTKRILYGVSTNFEGEYQLDSLEPGVYDVEATFTGFSKEIYEDLHLKKGDTLMLDFFMYESSEKLSLGCGPIYEYTALSKEDSMLLAEREFKKERLEVFPNPATDRLKIKIQSPGHFEYRFSLVDMQGRPVKKMMTRKSLKKEMVVKDLPRGVYQYSLTGLGGVLKEGKVLLY